MPLVTATDLDTLRDDFRAQIEAMTPRLQRAQASQGWKYYRKKRPATASARWFRLEWGPGRYTPNGFMGPNMVDTTVSLIIATDYGGIPEDDALVIAEDDHYQLRDILNSRKAPIVPGLVWVESEGPPEAVVEDEGDQAQIEHIFEIRYMKARARP